MWYISILFAHHVKSHLSTWLLKIVGLYILLRFGLSDCDKEPLKVAIISVHKTEIFLIDFSIEYNNIHFFISLQFNFHFWITKFISLPSMTYLCSIKSTWARVDQKATSHYFFPGITVRHIVSSVLLNTNRDPREYIP